jgi:transcriptional regulator with XRE-family HTH domain
MTEQEDRPIKARRQALNLTADMFASYSGLDVNILLRLEAGQMAGTRSEEKALAALSAYEAGDKGSQLEKYLRPPVDPGLGYNPSLSWKEQPTEAARQAARAAQVARIAAWRADQETLEAERREANNQRVRDRVLADTNLGLRLVELRERSGLTLPQIAAFSNVRREILSKMERGLPVGLRDTSVVLDAYEAAAALGASSFAPERAKKAAAKG